MALKLLGAAAAGAVVGAGVMRHVERKRSRRAIGAAASIGYQLGRTGTARLHNRNTGESVTLHVKRVRGVTRAVQVPGRKRAGNKKR